MADVGVAPGSLKETQGLSFADAPKSPLRHGLLVSVSVEEQPGEATPKEALFIRRQRGDVFVLLPQDCALLDGGQWVTVGGLEDIFAVPFLAVPLEIVSQHGASQGHYAEHESYGEDRSLAHRTSCLVCHGVSNINNKKEYLRGATLAQAPAFRHDGAKSYNASLSSVITECNFWIHGGSMSTDGLVQKTLFGALTLGISLMCVVVLAWPGAPGSDPNLDPPNDPNFLHRDQEGNIVDGEWNLWSFTPDIWADNPGFRPEEVMLGTGIWADRAWQWTPGRPDVLIAVLDSGARWGRLDLVNQYYLNRGELSGDGQRPRVPDDFAGDPFDVNGDGKFNVADYTHFFPEESLAALDSNGNGLVDPRDLIRAFSDGVDDDGNGYLDDISGWDFFWHDNDPHDDTDFGHGDGEAKDSAAEGDNGEDTIGVCPRCSVLMVRVGDSFVTDSNDFADGAVFAVDSGAEVLQEALGAVNHSAFARGAIEYAYLNGVAVVASAADELSFHHNFPGTNNHTLYVHAIIHDKAREEATTFLNYNNCTNHGAQLILSTPGRGCSSEATGVTAGHVGLLYSAAKEVALDPPLNGAEVHGLLIMSADDIFVPSSLEDDREGLPCTRSDQFEVCGDDGTFRCILPVVNAQGGGTPVGMCVNDKFPAGPGWDFHFGYGRNNAEASVKMIFEDQIPPEVDIVEPQWFETLYPSRQSTLEITGRVGARVDGRAPRYESYEYVVELAAGSVPGDGDWVEITSGTTPGMDGVLATVDLGALPGELDLGNAPSDPHEDMFTVRVRVQALPGEAQQPIEGEFRKAFFVHEDPSLLPGFPVRLGTSAESSPKLVDIDGDGAEEIVTTLSDGTLHAWKGDGTEAAGFPVELGLRPGHDVEDASGYTGSCAYRADKTGCVAGLGVMDPVVRQSMISGPAVGDLEGDGDFEIVASTLDGQVFAFHHTGEPVEGFPVSSDFERSALARDPDIAVGKLNTLDHGFFSAPVLADLDGDGDLEILQTGMDQHLYVWGHDGATQPGFPVLCRDTIEGNKGARIVTTPAVGDLDGDGSPEIILGSNEVYGGSSLRAYLVRAQGMLHPDGPFALGGPVNLSSIVGEVLPFVGKGVPSNSTIADVDGDGRLEFAIEGIAGLPIMYRLDPEENSDGLVTVTQVNPNAFGAESNTVDAPAYPLINHGSFGHLDPSGDLSYVKGTAGVSFAFAFAEGGTRAVFDRDISAWRVNPASREGGGQPAVEGFPQKMEDWQFFMNPALVDLTGDGLSEVLVGSGGYLVRALDYKGREVEGFPKFTGGWVIASPAVGDLDGDGSFEVVTLTRNGWLYAWKTGASTENRLDWNGYGHDLRNTNNHETPFARYGENNDLPIGGENNDQPDMGAEPDMGGMMDVGYDASGADMGQELATTPETGLVVRGSGCAVTGDAAPRRSGAWLFVLGLMGLVARRRGR